MTANTSPSVGLTARVVIGNDGRGTEGFDRQWRNPNPPVDLVEDCPRLVAYSCRLHVLLLSTTSLLIYYLYIRAMAIEGHPPNYRF